jgi:transcriptional regulator GlxA family with amidase domain
MQLVLLSSALNQPVMQHAQGPSKKVAIFLFDGVQIIDYAGPWEVFGGAGYEVFTVARNREPLTTVYGMTVTPHHGLKDHPKPDVVVVPGGQVFSTQNDPEVKRWLNEQARQAEVVLSVCNGAFILAKAGLLRGLEATTTRSLVEGLAAAGPEITPVQGVPFVDNGRIITSGGLSMGIDAALHVVSRLSGKEAALQVARGLEYEWRRK